MRLCMKGTSHVEDTGAPETSLILLFQTNSMWLRVESGIWVCYTSQSYLLAILLLFPSSRSSPLGRESEHMPISYKFFTIS